MALATALSISQRSPRIEVPSRPSIVNERFELSPGLKEGLRHRRPNWGFGQLSEAVYYRCVAVGTKVLTADLRWVNAEDLSVGDALLGVDELPQSGYRRMRSSQVEDTGIREDECFEVKTDRGSVVVSTQHPFLARKSKAAAWSWVKVEGLKSGSKIQFTVEPWEEEDGDSWLAGMFDGEGTLGQNQNRVAASQNVGNGVQERIADELFKRGFTPAIYVESKQHRQPIANTAINGLGNMLHFLGQVRPMRLLANWQKRLAENPPSFRMMGEATVESITPVGRKQIVSLQTSTATFIAEGMVCHNTYSRIMPDGNQEQWGDTVIRVVEGVMSIRKDWYKNVLGKRWDDKKYQAIAAQLAAFIFEMKLLPPGRGLWAMGTDYVFERGSHALQNCGFVEVTDSLSDSASWLMDSLMCGVGVGFSTHTARLPEYRLPLSNGHSPPYVIPDTREGWAESTRMLVESYEQPGIHEVHFDYSEVRPAGLPLKGFGGISSGPGPLVKLHERIRSYLDSYVQGRSSQTRLIADVMNAIGACVVAGNVRRSAEIALGSPLDDEFLNLKNYELYPDREEIGWMSNNTVVLSDREHFSALPRVAELVKNNGEPGILNMLNARKYGRIGDRMEDDVTGVNPCGEILLESYETCNLVEVFPTRCQDDAEVFAAMKLATFYASTVSLLKSHSPETNEVVSRNHRIGVSVSGIADWIDSTNMSHVFDVLNVGYEQVVRPYNTQLAKDAGVPASIRVTTVKPSGSVSLLAGASAGMHHPLDGYVLRRMRVAQDSPVGGILKKSGVPFEQDSYSDRTEVFEFPLKYGNGRTRSVKHVSVWEQAAIVSMLQEAWADNAVSNTLTVQPNELNQIESVLAAFAPKVKSLALMPDRDGAYEQMPLEKITKVEFEERRKKLGDPDWSEIIAGDGSGSRFCDSDACEIP